MQRAVFVSDLHIASPDDPRGRLFLRFLESLSRDDVTHLVLLGDIFDLWLADHRYFIDRYRKIIAELERLRDAGVEIHYFEGNHDLHLTKYWAGQLGLNIHRGPIYLSVADRQLRLEHGDQMDPDDRGYRFLRWFLRTPVMTFVIHHLPGNLAARIGERASVSSRAYTSETKTITNEDAIAKIRRHATEAHGERAFDILIAGHVHLRDDYRGETANGQFRAINLGTWLDAPCYFAIDESAAEFVELDAADMAQLPPREPVPVAETT